MSILRFILRFIMLLLVLIAGLLIVGFSFGYISKSKREKIIQRWSQALIWSTGIQIRTLGQPLIDRSVLWAANHVSWIDIFILNCQRGASFIAKQEIRSWPILGWLVAAAGTLFIERGSKASANHTNNILAAHFAQNSCIGLFPEGTTSAGWTVAHMYGGMMQSALQMQVPIQPVALRFFYRDQRSDRVAYIGEQNLLQNIWVLLSSSQVMVEVEFLTPIDTHKQDIHRQIIANEVRDRLLMAIDPKGEYPIYDKEGNPIVHPAHR